MRSFLTILTATAIMLATSASVDARMRPADVGGIVEHVAEPAAVMRQGRCTTLDQAVEQVRRQYNGRIVSAETRVSGGRETHIIKVLTSDGTVRTVRIPGCRV